LDFLLKVKVKISNRNQASDQAINYFDNLLNQILFQIGQINTNDIKELRENDYVPLSDQTIALLTNQLSPPISNLTIYYPISRYDEFDPISVDYNIPVGIKPIDILGAISTFYNQPLAENNILAYVQRDTDTYAHLLDELRIGQQVTLKDVMIGLVFVEGMHPHNDGYMLDLHS
jgi:hypothetical protein